MIKVGYPIEKDSKKKYTYRDCEYDADMWSDAKKFIPADFDLCFLKTKEGKTKMGWASAYNWDGLHVNDKDEVVAWKKE